MQIPSQHHDWTTWIGTDEAVKGIILGRLVVAGVYVNPQIREILHTLGVRDGKQLSDSQVRKLAQEMGMRCGDNISWLDLEPTLYKRRYNLFRNKGQNLNHLLASLHAEVIRDLRKRVDCHHILVDRFAKEEVLATQLGMPLGFDIELVQITEGRK